MSDLCPAFAEENGREVDIQGGAFPVAFFRARDALGMAAQRAVATHSWQEGTALRIRMGLHKGEPVNVEMGYIRLDVQHAAVIFTHEQSGVKRRAADG